MQKFPVLLLFLLPALLCAQIANNRILFVSNLNGGQEVPPLPGEDARGVATILISEDRTTASIHGVFSGLTGPVTACHFHTGAEATAGPVYVDLSDNITDNRLRAEIPLPADFMAKALTEQVYLNVHTAAHPSGEIRGQLFLKSDVMSATALDGASEVPPVTTNASGIFDFVYSPGRTKGLYFAVVDGLSGPITAAHIHDGAAGTSGPVYAPLTVTSNNTLVGELDFTSMPDFLGKLEAEGLYVNIHTAANPNGEVRGQLHSPGPFCFDAVLNGDQETPPVTSSAGGLAVASLTANLDTLVYKVTFHGLTPTAAHFHRGTAGTAGPVVIGLTQSNYPNFYAGRVAVSPEVAGDFIRGDMYVNIHTAAHPSGEIRGQVIPVLRTVYAFDLCGGQEVPPTGSPAEGAAVVSMDRGNTHLDYLYIVDALSASSTAAHIHDGAPGMNGPVYVGLFAPSPAVGSGQFEATGEVFEKLESGDTYLNVHTGMFPNGEVRGQITRGLNCAANVSATTPLLDAARLFPNPTSGAAELRFHAFEDFDGQLLLRNVMGQTLFRQNRRFEAGEQAWPLDLAALAPGLYFVEMRSARHGVVAAMKLVKE